MEKRREEIGQFCRRTDFMNKLRARLEDIERGQGFGIFEGLQTRGFCTVAIHFAGNTADVSAMELRPEIRAKIEAKTDPQENKPVIKRDKVGEKPRLLKKKLQLLQLLTLYRFLQFQLRLQI